MLHYGGMVHFHSTVSNDTVIYNQCKILTFENFRQRPTITCEISDKLQKLHWNEKLVQTGRNETNIEKRIIFSVNGLSNTLRTMFQFEPVVPETFIYITFQLMY